MPAKPTNAPNAILAHVQLLRAVDQLLTQADVVRERREALEQLLSADPADKHCSAVADSREGR